MYYRLQKLVFQVDLLEKFGGESCNDKLSSVKRFYVRWPKPTAPNFRFTADFKGFSLKKLAIELSCGFWHKLCFKRARKRQTANFRIWLPSNANLSKSDAALLV